LAQVFAQKRAGKKQPRLPLATSLDNRTILLMEKKGSLLNPPDIWNFRTRHDLTGADLARMLGVHKSQISRWETGQRESPLWLEKFLACLDQTLPSSRSVKASSKSYASGVGPQ
jgi:DNA-binding transcriptional regulator YiaG